MPGADSPHVTALVLKCASSSEELLESRHPPTLLLTWVARVDDVKRDMSSASPLAWLVPVLTIIVFVAVFVMESQTYHMCTLCDMAFLRAEDASTHVTNCHFSHVKASTAAIGKCSSTFAKPFCAV